MKKNSAMSTHGQTLSQIGYFFQEKLIFGWRNMEAAKSNTLKNCSMIATDTDSLVKVNMKLMDNSTSGIFKMFLFEILMVFVFVEQRTIIVNFFKH